MRQHHGSDVARTHRFSGATMAFIASLVAVTLAVAASAVSVYFLLAIATGADVVPRSSNDLRVLGFLLLVFGGFAVLMATRDELSARRRGTEQTSEGVSGVSPRLSSTGSRAQAAESR